MRGVLVDYINLVSPFHQNKQIKYSSGIAHIAVCRSGYVWRWIFTVTQGSRNKIGKFFIFFRIMFNIIIFVICKRKLFFTSLRISCKRFFAAVTSPFFVNFFIFGFRRVALAWVFKIQTMKKVFYSAWNRLMNRAGIAETHFAFCGVNVKIRKRRVYLHINRRHGMNAVGKPPLRAVFNSLNQRIFLNPSAVSENINMTSVVSVKLRSAYNYNGGKSRSRNIYFMQKIFFACLQDGGGKTLFFCSNCR